jgi:hypothetical protein
MKSYFSARRFYHHQINYSVFGTAQIWRLQYGTQILCYPISTCRFGSIYNCTQRIRKNEISTYRKTYWWKKKKLWLNKKAEVVHAIELDPESTAKLSNYYSKFMGSRVINLVIVYVLALGVAYLIPSYSSNPFIVWWLPLGMVFSATFVLGYFFQLASPTFLVYATYKY